MAGYFRSLKRGKGAESRVMRKSAIIWIFVACAIVYVRHADNYYLSINSLIITALVLLFSFFVVAFLGGIVAAHWYISFLRDVNAEFEKPTLSIFLTEFLFSLTSPILGSLFLLFLMYVSGQEARF